MGFILDPITSFKNERKTTMRRAIIFGLIYLLIPALLVTVVKFYFFRNQLVAFGTLIVIVSGFMYMIKYYFFGIIGLALAISWVHLWAYVFGAKGFTNTTKAVLFGLSPFFLLGWIPFFNYFTYLWSAILCGIGLITLHKLSVRKSIYVMAISVLVFIAIWFSVVFVIYATPAIEAL